MSPQPPVPASPASHESPPTHREPIGRSAGLASRRGRPRSCDTARRRSPLPSSPSLPTTPAVAGRAGRLSVGRDRQRAPASSPELVVARESASVSPTPAGRQDTAHGDHGVEVQRLADRSRAAAGRGRPGRRRAPADRAPLLAPDGLGETADAPPVPEPGASGPSAPLTVANPRSGSDSAPSIQRQVAPTSTTSAGGESTTLRPVQAGPGRRAPVPRSRAGGAAGAVLVRRRRVPADWSTAIRSGRALRRRRSRRPLSGFSAAISALQAAARSSVRGAPSDGRAVPCGRPSAAQLSGETASAAHGAPDLVVARQVATETGSTVSGPVAVSRRRPRRRTAARDRRGGRRAGEAADPPRPPRARRRPPVAPDSSGTLPPPRP